MKKKLLSLALALVTCLSLAAPAFAAETLTGKQLYPVGGWDNGPTLTLTGVVGETETQFDPSYIYDVEVGGSLVLEMTFPAGKNRSYNIMNGGFYVPHDLKEPDWNDSKAMETLGETWDIPASSQGGDFDESSGKTRFVYNFNETDMGQKNGMDKIIYPMIYWCDDANNDGQVDSEESDGSVYFGIRVVPAKSAEPAGVGSFTDVPAASPYADGIVWAVEQGITNGTSTTAFSPNNTCTTSHILTFLYRAAGSPDKGSDERAAVTAWANGLGIDTSDLSVPCTRAAAVTYMWKAAGRPSASGAPFFSDVPASAEYAQAVAWAVEKGITNGTSTSAFSPDKTCTHGQIVTFLYRDRAS